MDEALDQSSPETTPRRDTASLPLEAGLRALSEEMPRGRMSRALTAISDRLVRGEPLPKILQDQRDSAPLLLRELLQCGHSAGALGEVLAAWLDDTHRSAEMRRKILGALAYPAVLIGFLILLMAVVMALVVPEMGRLFEGFNTKLPGLTAALVKVSRGLRSYGLWILPGLAVVTMFLVLWPRISGSGYLYRRILHAVPVIGTAYRYSVLATFCRLLAELVRNRVSLPAAIRAAANGSRDAVLDHRCGLLADRIEGNGLPPDEAAKSIPEFPSQLIYVFRSANDREQFSETLRSTAEMYDAQARVRAELIPLIAEPVVIIGVAVVFVLFVVALFLPVLKLMSVLS